MQTIKECVSRSFRIDRAIAVAALAATLAAVCAAPSLADPMDAANMTTVPAGSIDYRVLADPDLSYFAIQRAHAYGMNDEQIAQAAKLAHYAEVPMSQVLSLVQDGRTMTDLAIMYGVNLDYLSNTSDWQDRIHDYMIAYHNTGMGALRNGPMEPTVASYSSSGFGPAIAPNGTTISPNGTTVMPNGTTVAPNGTTVTPNGTTVTPNGTTVMPNGTTTAPNGTTVTPDSTTVSPNGTTVAPNGTTTTPNGTTVAPDGTTTPGS